MSTPCDIHHGSTHPTKKKRYKILPGEITLISCRMYISILHHHHSSFIRRNRPDFACAKHNLEWRVRIFILLKTVGRALCLCVFDTVLVYSKFISKTIKCTVYFKSENKTGSCIFHSLSLLPARSAGSKRFVYNVRIEWCWYNRRGSTTISELCKHERSRGMRSKCRMPHFMERPLEIFQTISHKCPSAEFILCVCV